MGAGQGEDEAFEVPPHLPVRRSPLAACCISLLVVSLYAAMLSSARVYVDGIVQWASPDLHVVAAWSAVCCWCAVAALVAIGMVCGAWALASTIASYRRRLAFSRRTAGFLDQALEGSGLTDAECVVLGYLFRGFTAAGIARELTVSLNTARTHVRHVYAKLGVHGRSELFDAVERRLERYEERL